MADRPGVFSMLGDLTAAQRQLYAQAAGRRGGRASARRSKARTTSSRTPRRRRASGRGSKRTKLVKGSAAAKAWGRRMKALRKKRK